jgi:hypothetical protein
MITGMEVIKISIKLREVLKVRSSNKKKITYRVFWSILRIILKTVIKMYQI